MLSVLPGRVRDILLARGESAIAGTGLMITLIFLVALGGCVGWAITMQQRRHAAWHRRAVEQAGRTLAEGLAPLLAEGRADPAAALLARAVRTNDWKGCRLVIGRDLIVADTQAPSPAADLPPAPWPEATGPTDPPPTLTVPVPVPERGTARLVIEPGPPQTGRLTGTDQLALGVICVMGLGGLLLTYRMTRLRIRDVSAIRECLEAVERGEQDPQALKISEELGSVATVWNRLLEENARLKRQCHAQQVQQVTQRSTETTTELDVACDALSQGMILISNQMLIDYVNGAASIFLGHDRRQMLHQPFDQFIDQPSLVQAVRDLVAGKTTRRTIVEWQKGETPGQGVLRFIARPVRQHDHAAAMLVIEDITQQRIADQARHSFVANATHELRTPLTNIRAYLETAIEDGAHDSRLVMNSLNVVSDEVRRLERIVADLLSVTEIEAGAHALKRDDVALQSLLEKLQADFQQQAAERRIKLTFALAPKLPVIHGDREKVMLALTNLLGNAIKYTPEGGTVRVEASADETAFQVNVIDTGIGIRPEEQARIFEKFYRSQDPQVAKITGTGLGLALAREVVRLHGGDITVDSEPGKGSTFTLTLPVTTRVTNG